MARAVLFFLTALLGLAVAVDREALNADIQVWFDFS